MSIADDPDLPALAASKPSGRAAGRPARLAALGNESLWPAPEEPGRRGWLVIMVLLAIIGLYSWALAGYYTGAQGGVDQSGYLMTARLLAGDKNVDSIAAPAPPDPASASTAEHPKPSAAQTAPFFNFIRNRLSFVPDSPFQFASRMCIFTEPYGPPDPAKPAEYRVYAKYPFGFPLMAAIGRLFFGFDGMYLINPLCAVLACYFAYFLFRQVVSPYISLLGVLWLACNPLVLFYSNDANSHAPALMCIMIGFWGLLSWMRTGQHWRAWIAGLALGYACTVRYSEFLLFLPVLFAATINFRWNAKRVTGSLSLLAAWMIPVGILAAVSWISFGAPWKTGYSYCHESTGFSWQYLTGELGDPGVHKQANWDTLIDQLNHMGLFMLWPFAIAGLFAMLASTWRLGVTMALWVLPQTILYLLYYWAPVGENSVGYLRFFMTIMPGLILAALWILERGLTQLRGEKRASLVCITLFGLFALVAAALYVNGESLKGGWPLAGQISGSLWHLLSGSWSGFVGTVLCLGLIAGIWLIDREQAAAKVAVALGAGMLTALGCAMNLNDILPQVENTYTQDFGMRQTVDHVRALLPKGSVLFSDDSLLNQMDCVGDWKLVNAAMFNQGMFQNSKRMLETADKDKDQDDPFPVQQERSRFAMELLGQKNAAGVWAPKPSEALRKYEDDLIDRNFAQGRRIAFLVLERDGRLNRKERGIFPARKDCSVKVLGEWENPPAVSEPILQTGVGARARLARQPVPGRTEPCYVLYELVKNPPPAPRQPAAHGGKVVQAAPLRTMLALAPSH